jgi:hypothetical protein
MKELERLKSEITSYEKSLWESFTRGEIQHSDAQILLINRLKHELEVYANDTLQSKVILRNAYPELTAHEQKQIVSFIKADLKKLGYKDYKRAYAPFDTDTKQKENSKKGGAATSRYNEFKKWVKKYNFDVNAFKDLSNVKKSIALANHKHNGDVKPFNCDPKTANTYFKDFLLGK